MRFIAVRCCFQLEKVDSERYRIVKSSEKKGLQDRLGIQNVHGDLKQVFEPITDTVVETSKVVTKTITEASKEDYEASFIKLVKDDVLGSLYTRSSHQRIGCKASLFNL